MKTQIPHHRMIDGSRRSRPRPNSGIVLLIVLGMLSLFTVLVVSFVVFSSQMADSSYASQQRRQDEVLPKPPLDSAIMQLVIGTNDSRSAAFGASLLEDFYGVDGMQMRVGHRRGRVIPPPNNTKLIPAIPGGQLLLPMVGVRAPQPQSTLFKFPTNLVWWHFDGDPSVVTPPPGAVDPVNQPLRDRLRTYLDDALAGRIVTFDEGPLKDQSFRIVRSLGTDNGTPDQGNSITDPPEFNMAGNLVIDLSELGDEIVTINGVPEQLYLVAANFPNRLLYSPGPDDAPGQAGVDDDGANGVDDAGELGAPGSDDVGFRFVVNGAVFNGRGINPAGVTGLVRNGTVLDQGSDIEFTLNSRLTGTVYQGGDGTVGAFPEPDEGWDVADMENIFLAWQPSDHRRSALQAIYSGVDAAELNRQLGQYVIPSFHRPAIINYLMNAPIRIPGDILDPSDARYIERRFADIKAAPDNNSPNFDGTRLQYLVTRLRRATLRPLNFPHQYVNAANSDLNGDGDPFDGSPLFTGSNQAAILNRPLDLTGSLAQIVSQVEQLAVWLVNGPWDVDNDFDGLPDSVWVDLNLPTVVASDGQILRPMVAPLIEDWDGRINVNHTGSYNQLTSARFSTGPLQYRNDTDYFNVNTALDSFGRGGGLGPAEIDFSHLFAFEPALPPRFIGPVSTNQVGAPLSIDQVLTTRYGNLLNTRYGGQVYNYAFPYPYPAPADIRSRFLRLPGAGTRFDPEVGSDLLARIPFPGRAVNHRADSISGRPVDMAGVMKTRKDRNGSHRFTQLPAGDDIVNQPYEFGASEVRGDDEPFSAAEQIDFINGGALDGRLTQLLGDAANRNEALRRLLVTDSRSVDSPELPGGISFVHLFADKFGPAASPTLPLNQQPTHLQRMLAVELRKGSKLNLNRQIGNEQDDTMPAGTLSVGFAGIGDETAETQTVLANRTTTPTVVKEANEANNRASTEPAFPQIAAAFPNKATVTAHYASNSMTPSPAGPVDFDGLDTDGDGVLDQGTPLVDLDGDGTNDRVKMADGSELLARNLYCLMFALIEDETGGELVPNFPYPVGFVDAGTPANVDIRNRYVAKRLAQWAANAVDYRDVDAKCTRLRYDPNPFDANGFNLATAAQNTVWGMERPELQLTEAMAMHDKRLRRNLDKQPSAADPSVTPDGELFDDDDTSDPDTASDSDMDQFRIPQASAFVELQALAPQIVGNGESQPSLPGELYTSNALDLGRTIGSGNRISPVWRMAVGERTQGDPNKSTRWLFDADRMVELATNPAARQDVPNYLDDGTIDWTMPADMTAAVDNWNLLPRHAADIRPRLRLSTDPLQTEYVTLSDDDLNPANDAASPNPTRIRLERFVWFANLVPNPGLTVVSDPNSGMRPDNVFFNKPNRGAPGDLTLPENATPLLQPGQYAMVAPRAVTRFGQKSTSIAPNYEYFPSDQRLEFVTQTLTPAPAQPVFRLDYYRNGNANPQTPNYLEDATATVGHDVGHVLPLVCESLYPHEVDPAAMDWATYASTFAVGEQVDMGFNISAPLPNVNYYTAPTHRITTMDAGGGVYPYVDGYRDYENAVGYHPDTPLDHVAGTPLEQNNFEWAAVGTHQEAATIFLQRLADPSIPWHPVDNPYVTVDFLPMDLTTFNGEHDVREKIDRMVIDPAAGPPGAVSNQPVDNVTDWDTTVAGDFVPAIRLDTRRKIPDAEEDRGISVLLPTVASPSTLAQRERVVIAKRSPLSMTTNLLRPSNPPAIAAPGADYFGYELGSMWDNGSLTAAASANLDTRYGKDTSGNWLTFDRVNDPFTQSLGFVNREYGVPVRSTSPRANTFGVSAPDEVLFMTVPWMNREFQSVYDLMNVPAVSRTSLLATYGPGTRLEDDYRREVPIPFDHLLGFDQGYATFRPEDLNLTDGSRPRRPLGVVEDADGNLDTFTGERAGFEQIFDYVDVGPVWFDSQRWFDPEKVQFRRDITYDSGTTRSVQVHEMFNRAVETLQPPYNYIGRHRTPGKINLNTTPDYIRKGPRYTGPNNQMLDGYEDPADTSPNPRLLLEDPTNVDSLPNAANLISANPSNFPVNGNGFTNEFGTSELFGNGSVYRSLAWGISTPYELDSSYGAPATMGENNRYEESVDTSFGRSFKAYVEARRGYSTTLRGSTYLGNPDLDARYPTRFAGVFGPAQASSTPSLQRFMRQGDRSGVGMPRRTHDMTVLRPHPDFDIRTMSNAQRTAVNQPTDTRFSLEVEFDAATSPLNDATQNSTDSVVVPGLTPNKQEVRELRMPLVNTGLFERPEAELHMNLRNLDRDSYYRFQNAARMSGVTTHHSNVFHIRLTLGYFVVDPTTGAVGREYINETGEPIRSRASYVVDRTIPVGFLRGKNMDAERTILYSEVEE
ncbi:hypothetical protein FYK55_20080 [Roseiconus nitratireducens]|uniref:Uncharacterized protein n=1 Tax=Roseiconus nitratireducens TaxID=2605748 RepID=A0A5M6D328_9BACT|nr:hypothetical protein [Roseiconus nitratireducens]KAA5540692.1 hypothetical protein FYK55_20080 [Roseiconus nitratireducens]